MLIGDLFAGGLQLCLDVTCLASNTEIRDLLLFALGEE